MSQLSTIDNGRDLATREASAMPISLLPVEAMQGVLAEYDERRLSFRKWLLSKMVEGVHFGVIPGCEPRPGNPRQWKPRPSLYKAGADFLFDLFMLDARFAPDAEAWRMLGSISGQIVMRCEAVSRGNSPFYPDRPKGEVVGQGYGAGKSGEKGRDANKTIKIADKCAKVDCIINLLGISDLFTQDQEPPPPNPAPQADASAPKVSTREERRSADGDQAQRVTAAQLNAMVSAWRAAGMADVNVKPFQPVTQFVRWVQGQLKTDTDFSSVGNWTVDDADRIACVLDEIRSAK